CITGPICSTAAIFLGAIGIRSPRRGFAISGIVLGFLSLLIFVLLTHLEFENRKLLTKVQEKFESSAGSTFDKAKLDDLQRAIDALEATKLQPKPPNSREDDEIDDRVARIRPRLRQGVIKDADLEKLMGGPANVIEPFRQGTALPDFAQ